jgi:hypothetical protein
VINQLVRAVPGPQPTFGELSPPNENGHPVAYLGDFLSTVQRRVKIWRAELARSLAFGDGEAASQLMTSGALRHAEASRVRGHQQSPELWLSERDNPQEHRSEART